MLHEEFPEFWDAFLGRSLEAMAKTHTHMIDIVKPEVPTYIVRFEDLKLRPEEVMTEVMQFLLNVDSIEGTIAEHRVNKYAKQGSSSLYKLKSKTNNLSKHRDIYTDDQMERMRQHLRDYIRFFGYTGQNDTEDGSPETEFFDYSGDLVTKEEEAPAAELNGYKRVN